MGVGVKGTKLNISRLFWTFCLAVPWSVVINLVAAQFFISVMGVDTKEWWITYVFIPSFIPIYYLVYLAYKHHDERYPFP